MLLKHGADQFLQGEDQSTAYLMFRIRGRQVRFNVRLPAEDEFAYTEARRMRRTKPAQRAAWEQAIRQKWRQLYLVIRARLEEAACGIVTYEEAFMLYTVLPDKSTVREFIGDQIEQSYRDGHMPLSLPFPESGRIALPPSSRER